jgi:two-component system NarL family response regulator
MASKLLEEFKAISQKDVPPAPTPGLELPRLTQRELEILQRVAKGKLNREIGAELFISENTVRNHIRNILDKLQMHSRMEAAMYAVRQRLIDPD